LTHKPEIGQLGRSLGTATVGMTMPEGTIVKWLAEDGALIKKEQEMLEITTEKFSSIIEATATGKLKIIAQEGALIPCGEVIAEITE
jgi:pyruvate/2-oxoglutarate dehydrogenase complex dihydrolipoamide acyltransferase (E2) component